MRTWLLTLSAIFALIGPITYVISILRGRTKPHRTTRFVLAIVLTLNFVSVLAADGNFGAELYSGIICLHGLVFFLLSLKRGIGGTSPFDVICLILALIGIVAWQITDNPHLAIYFAITADLVAYLPAFVKTWRQPDTESPWLYILSALAAFLSLIAYEISPVSTFQIFTTLCGAVMLVCIYHVRIRSIFRSVTHLSP